jgi:hypothetical protein
MNMMGKKRPIILVFAPKKVKSQEALVCQSKGYVRVHVCSQIHGHACYSLANRHSLVDAIQWEVQILFLDLYLYFLHP